jgi:nitrogen fixation protein NifU and related proteins
MQIEQLYQDIILDHYKKPRGRGLREPYSAQVRHVNPTCGDEIDLRVSLVDGVVADVSYEGMGCSISQAAASVLYEVMVGLGVPEAMSRADSFTEMIAGRAGPDEDAIGDGVAFAGVSKYPARVKCALLAWMAFKDATVQAGGSE